MLTARELLHLVSDIGFRTTEPYPAGFDLVVRQSFLQGRFGVALQWALIVECTV